jgi:hypothetical protein
MSNYQKWDTWNADEESEKLTAREETDQLENTAAKDEKKLLAQLGNMEVQTKQVAEAYRSQSAVDALKAKGGMRNRRKRGTAAATASTGTELLTSGDQVICLPQACVSILLSIDIIHTLHFNVCRLYFVVPFVQPLLLGFLCYLDTH